MYVFICERNEEEKQKYKYNENENYIESTILKLLNSNLYFHSFIHFAGGASAIVFGRTECCAMVYFTYCMVYSAAQVRRAELLRESIKYRDMVGV